MIKVRAQQPSNMLAHIKKFSIQRVEKAALFATDKAIRNVHRETVATLREVGLGRVTSGSKGGVVGVTSDLVKGGKVKRYGAEGFSASGVMFQKKYGARINGILRSYGFGATILPKRGGWLWIASDKLQRRVGIKGQKGTSRLTPALYNRTLANRIGPLFELPGRHNGERILAVKDISVRSVDGRLPRRLPKRGGLRDGREKVDQFIAFVGIKRTERLQRFDARQLAMNEARNLATYFSEHMRKGE